MSSVTYILQHGKNKFNCQKNCSNTALSLGCSCSQTAPVWLSFHGIQPFRNRLLQCQYSTGPQILPANLPQCGIPMGTQLFSGIPLLSVGSSRGCRGTSAPEPGAAPAPPWGLQGCFSHIPPLSFAAAAAPVQKLCPTSAQMCCHCHCQAEPYPEQLHAGALALLDVGEPASSFSQSPVSPSPPKPGRAHRIEVTNSHNSNIPRAKQSCQDQGARAVPRSVPTIWKPLARGTRFVPSNCNLQKV